MATLGSTSKPGTSQEYFGLNTTNQTGIALTLPSGGPWNITRLGGWFAGVNGDTPAYKLCLWSASGTLLRSSTGGSVASQAFALGNATNAEQAITPYEVAGGTTVIVGWSRDPAEDMQWPLTGSGSHYHDTQTGSWPGNLVGFSTHSGQVGAYLEYEASNAVPTAPTLVSPASGTITTDLTPTLDWTHNDPDGDAQSAAQVQIDSSNSFPSPTTYNVSGSTSTYTLPTQSRGATIYWRVRTSDAEGYGPWSGGRSLKFNSLPTATKVAPLASALAYVHNLGTDLNVWTSGGSHAKPRFDWTYADADGHAQSRYRVRVYSASSGGTTLHDSGEVSSSSTLYDSTWAGVLGTEYWWTIAVRDSLGEWSAESSRTAFKMRWAQAIYEYAVVGGASSSAWSFTSGTKVETVAFLYATATGAAGAGRSAWKTTIGALTPAAYLNVMVRMATDTAATDASLADMTFSYVAAAIQPDRWEFSTPTTDWLIDRDVRRFGSQALRLKRSTTTGDRWAGPYTKTAGDGIAVTTNTVYTLSCYVRTAPSAPLASAISLRIIEPTSGKELTELYINASKQAATDSNITGNRDGWYRLSLTFNSDDYDVLYPVLWQAATGSAITDEVWCDAMQLEEASVPTPWRPGLVGDPVVLDVGGVVVDEQAGGIFRLRSSIGKTAELSDLVHNSKWAGHGIARGTDFTVASTATWTKVTGFTDLVTPSSGFTRNTDCIVIGPDEPTAMYLIWLWSRVNTGADQKRAGVGIQAALGADPGSGMSTAAYAQLWHLSHANNAYQPVPIVAQFAANTWIAMQVWQDVAANTTFAAPRMIVARLGTI